VPWLLIANRASNDAARYEAIYRASAAQRFEAHFPDFFGLLQLPGVRSQAPQIRSALEEDLNAMRLTLPTLPYQPFFRFCNFPGVADASRTGVCSDLAKLFLERDRTMIGFGVGVKLAQAAGWSPDLVNTLREKKTEYERALQQAVAPEGGHPERETVSSDCESQAVFEDFAADYARLGERGVAEKFIKEASSGDAFRWRR
jgi:hypothetical protein